MSSTAAFLAPALQVWGRCLLCGGHALHAAWRFLLPVSETTAGSAMGRVGLPERLRERLVGGDPATESTGSAFVFLAARRFAFFLSTDVSVFSAGDPPNVRQT